MGKNILANWIKEFASLVFIQTIQAFIFAIVMTIVVTTLTGNGGGLDKDDALAATGVIAIIALTSISKIEDLVKKIFGVSSSITDPTIHGGLKSFATGMLAAKAAGRVLNNAPKIGKGIGSIVESQKSLAKARARYTRDTSVLLGGGNAKKSSTTSGAAGGESKNPWEDWSDKQEQSPTPPTIRNASSGGQASGGASGSFASAAAGWNALDKDKYYKIKDTYDDAMAEAKKKRREGIVNITSGITETGGAVLGGTVGAVAGLSTGDVSKIIEGTGFGIGAGDFVGGIPSKIAGGVLNVESDIQSVSKQRKRLEDLVDRNLKDISVSRKGMFDTQYGQAKRKIEKLQKEVEKNINAGNME